MSDNAISSTTQEFLDVYDITNNMVILKDGTVSVILRIGTMNFSLLAEQEQDAIIYTYGALLNSLNFPIQINIQSQTKDATKYLRLLDEQTEKASSANKANLIRKYRNFVSQLIRERNVLEKKFFMIIPASPGEMGFIAPKNVLPGQTEFDIKSVEKTVLLEKSANILEPRRDHLISQCNRLGLYAEQLSTQEIIQNFYINYNPEAQEGQEITSSVSYQTPLVRASFSRNAMQNMNPNNSNQATPVQKTTSVQNSATDPVEATAPAAAQTPQDLNPMAAPVMPATPANINENQNANLEVSVNNPVTPVQNQETSAIPNTPSTPDLNSAVNSTENQTVNPITAPANNSPEIDLKLDANQLQNNETVNESSTPNIDLNTNINDLEQNSSMENFSTETTAPTNMPEQAINQNLGQENTPDTVTMPSLDNTQQAPATAPVTNEATVDANLNTTNMPINNVAQATETPVSAPTQDTSIPMPTPVSLAPAQDLAQAQAPENQNSNNNNQVDFAEEIAPIQGSINSAEK
jgi:hypothetical protein